jgi:hypothetical protein
MSLQPSALTTLQKLKVRLNIVDASKDAQLEDAITAASQMIADFVGRKIHYEAAITEVVPGHGTPELLVGRTPIWSIASVTDDDGGVLDVEVYSTTEGDDAKAGIIRSSQGWAWSPGIVGGGVAQDPVIGHESSRFTVIYAAGWLTPNQADVASVERIPATIETAALMLATSLFAADGVDVGVAGESLMSYSVTFGNPETLFGESGMPKRIEAMLAPYRHFVQA